MFAENQDYGMHGERVRTACWGYLCQSGGMELKEVMRKIEVLACIWWFWVFWFLIICFILLVIVNLLLKFSNAFYLVYLYIYLCRIYVEFVRISLYLSCGLQTSWLIRFKDPDAFIAPLSNLNNNA